MSAREVTIFSEKSSFQMHQTKTKLYTCIAERQTTLLDFQILGVGLPPLHMHCTKVLFKIFLIIIILIVNRFSFFCGMDC